MSEKKSRKSFMKKRWLIPAIIILALVVFRIMLPSIVKNYVNKVLEDIPGYYGHVEDIDIALLRGAYVINGMYLNKVNAQTQVSFINFPKSDISIEWRALFHGEIVSEIIMYDPEVIYIFEDMETTSAAGDADVEDWTKALTDLVPIDINHFEVHRGKVAFVELQADPNIDLHISQVELTATNLRNVIEKERMLPSTLKATGVSVGQGQVSVTGNLNLLKEIPDMNIEFNLVKADARALNDFTKHYAKIDFNEGQFELFGEIAIADSYLKGYVKPIFTDLKLLGPEDSFFGKIWEGFVGFFKFILKNQKHDTLATRVPLEGDLSNVEAGIWPTISSIFANAWIKAFNPEIDDKIEYEDAFQEKELSRKERRKLRKEEREKEKD